MRFNHAGVAVDFVNGPRADDAGTGPCSGPVTVKDGGLVAKETLPILGVHEVDHPLGEELGDILIITTRADKDLSVAGPAEAFIALWAVGGNFEVVRALTPDDVLLDFIHHRVRTFKGAGLWRIRIECYTGDGVSGRLFFEATDLHIAETVEGEARLPDFFAATFEHIGINSTSGAQVDGVGAAIVLEHLSKDHGDLISSLAVDLQACPS